MTLSHAKSALGNVVHGGLTRHGPLSPHDGLQRQTQKWVAQTFFGALLKQMHEGPFHSNLMDGGRGGQAFGALLDQHLADRMAHAAGRKLVGSIVRHIEKSGRGHTAREAYRAAAQFKAGAKRRPPAGAFNEGYAHVTPTRGA